MCMSAAPVETHGDSADDYTQLSLSFSQRLYPSFSPNRTVTGASQELQFNLTQPGDKIMLFRKSAADDTSTDLCMKRNITGNETANTDQTIVYTFSSGNTSVILHTAAAPGTWTLCFLPVQKVVGVVGLWVHINNANILVISKPTFSPYVGIAGSVTPLSFMGTLDGDTMVLALDCSDFTRYESITNTTLVPQVLFDAGLSTNFNMAVPTTLQLCYATSESGADSLNDFVALERTFEQLKPIEFGPGVVMEGAPQTLYIDGAAASDQVVFVQGQDCQNPFGGPVMNKTEAYNLTNLALHQEISFFAGAGLGTFRVCYKPAIGLWTFVPGLSVLIFPKPSFLPGIGIAGTPTPITFNVTSNSIGSYVIFTQGHCNDLDMASKCEYLGFDVATGACASGNISCCRTTLVNSQISTTSVMTAALSLNVCAASPESGGDHPSDYSALEGNFTQQAPITFFPNVTMEQTEQLITVSGGMSGDEMFWTQAMDCSEIPLAATPTVTVVYLLVGSSSNSSSNSPDTEDIVLHTTTSSGEWYVCYKPSGGLWTSLPTLRLKIRPLPQYSPAIGIAGSVTTIRFTGGDIRDFLVLTASTNCSNAHLVQSGVDSLARSEIGDMVQTTTLMNATTELTFCYAAFETGGDTNGDFVAMSAKFEQTTPFTFSPLRIVTGAAQLLNLVVRNSSNGDQVKFVQSANCTLGAMNSSATADSSAVHTLDMSGTNQDIALHTAAANGTWYACYKPAGGMWTHVRKRQFTVISKPWFVMSVGLAGSPTPIRFSGAHDNDFIVLSADCTSAQVVTSGPTARAKQNISSSMIVTTVSMTQACTLKVCYGN